MNDEISDTVVIEGILHPSLGGGKAMTDEHWTFRFSFEHWHDAYGLHQDKLRLERRLEKPELDHFLATLKPYSVLQIRVRFLEPTRAEFLELLSDNFQDDFLLAQAVELQKPVILPHAIFGDLTFNRRVEWFSAKVIWDEQPIELIFNAYENSDLEKTLESGLNLWQEQHKWVSETKDFAAQILQPLKNDNWLDEDENESAVSITEFKQRMTLESITIGLDGLLSFIYNDGDLFFGHVIIVEGTISQGFQNAYIAG